MICFTIRWCVVLHVPGGGGHSYNMIEIVHITEVIRVLLLNTITNNIMFNIGFTRENVFTHILIIKDLYYLFHYY